MGIGIKVRKEFINTFPLTLQKLNKKSYDKEYWRHGCFGVYNDEDLSIFIRRNMTCMNRVLTLIHEMGHAVCDLSQCGCIDYNSVRCEYHAMLYAMNKVLDIIKDADDKLKEKLLTEYWKDTECYILGNDKAMEKAARKIKKLKAYRKHFC